MIRRDVGELLSLVERFELGSDRTRSLVDEIEGIVVECCIDEPWFDDLSLALAQYLPGEDPLYFNAEALLAELRPIRSILRDRLGFEGPDETDFTEFE